MFLWYPVLDLARAPRRTARKKGSGYENAADQPKGALFMGTKLTMPGKPCNCCSCKPLCGE